MRSPMVENSDRFYRQSPADHRRRAMVKMAGGALAAPIIVQVGAIARASFSVAGSVQ